MEKKPSVLCSIIKPFYFKQADGGTHVVTANTPHFFVFCKSNVSAEYTEAERRDGLHLQVSNFVSHLTLEAVLVISVGVQALSSAL